MLVKLFKPKLTQTKWTSTIGASCDYVMAATQLVNALK